MNDVLAERILLEKASTGDSEQQFELGIFYWKKKDYEKAERWLRYAAVQGHTKAISRLAIGIRRKDFINTEQRVNTLTIGLLESLITPQPSEQQIKELEVLLLEYLEKHYGTGQQRYERRYSHEN